MVLACLQLAAVTAHRDGMQAPFSAADFVARFTEFWRAPSPDRLTELLHPDVVLIQQLAPTTRGIAAAQHQFRRFCRCLPGLHATVHHWHGDEALVFIEFTLHASFGRDTLHWPTLNRLIMHDGKANERATYFDSLAVLPTFARHPSVWWHWCTSSRPTP